LSESAIRSESLATTGGGAACMSYLAGVVDTITVGQRWNQWNVDVCVPKHARTPEVVQIYTAWALRHPEMLYLPASASVARALGEAFPCKRKSTRGEKR